MGRRKREQPHAANAARGATIASRRGSTGVIGLNIRKRLSWNKNKRRKDSAAAAAEADDGADASPHSSQNADSNEEHLQHTGEPRVNSTGQDNTRRHSSFDVFDGTNSIDASPFSEFIFDGDEEDR